MAKGISVHVGVNRANPLFQVAELRGCANDANAMRQIAIGHHFEAREPLLNEDATFTNVKKAILDAVPLLHDGDMFLFTFSGHGSNADSAIDEEDGRDETILLHDSILIDNYLRRNLWSQFEKGVRILGIADCCHAGSALFAITLNDAAPVVGLSSTSELGSLVFSENLPPPDIPTDLISKGFSSEDQERIIAASPDIHNKIKAELLPPIKAINAKLLTLGACDDGENALDAVDSTENSVFTKAMLEVLVTQNPPGNYDDLMAQIRQNLLAKGILQHPTRFPIENPDAAFLGERPFSISPP
jgi:hypothetical protein